MKEKSRVRLWTLDDALGPKLRPRFMALSVDTLPVSVPSTTPMQTLHT